jgi:uncharacterized protein YceH (UPF0502 family)
MRKLLELLLTPIVEDIAAHLVDETKEGLEQYIGNVSRDLCSESDNHQDQLNDLEAKIEDMKSEVASLKEEIDDMKSGGFRHAK